MCRYILPWWTHKSGTCHGCGNFLWPSTGQSARKLVVERSKWANDHLSTVKILPLSIDNSMWAILIACRLFSLHLNLNFSVFPFLCFLYPILSYPITRSRVMKPDSTSHVPFPRPGEQKVSSTARPMAGTLESCVVGNHPNHPVVPWLSIDTYWQNYGDLGITFFWDTINLVMNQKPVVVCSNQKKASSSGCSQQESLAPVVSCKSGCAASFDAAWQMTRRFRTWQWPCEIPEPNAVL